MSPCVYGVVSLGSPEIRGFRGPFREKAAVTEQWLSDVGENMSSGFVYFIQRGRRGPIKIGFTYDVAERRRALQTGSAERLHILAVAPGSKIYEQSAHEKLKQYRMKGEWFQPAPAVLAAIEAIRHDPEQGIFDLALFENLEPGETLSPVGRCA